MPGESDTAPAKTVATRLPPYSDEAEKGVLGSVLQDADLMDLCIENHLLPESFYVPSHRVIFETLMEMSQKRHPIDVLTVTNRLREGGLIEKAGGDLYLHRLIDSTPTTAHAGYYIETVRQKHVLRQVIACARTAENDCYSPDEDALSLLGRVEQSFFDITDINRATLASWPELIKSVMTHIDELGQDGDTSLKTGFSDIDRELTGLRPANMVILAARPSMGKTSLAMNMASNIATGHVGGDGERKAVGVFSLEMSSEDLVLRMLCTHAEVSMHKLRGGFLDHESGHRKLVTAASNLNKALIYLDDSAGLDVNELRARARRMKHKHDIKLFIIDYLQLLHYREFSRQGKQIETGAISGCLKSMAKELNVPIIVLSQLSRAPENRDGVPRLADLRDSGSIEQDADVVLLLRRPSLIPGDPDRDDKRLAIVEVAKNRNGPVHSGMRLDFDAELTRFSDRKEHGVDGLEPDRYDGQPGDMEGNAG
ncbi:MAG: replicative DNA helicase [bacterium]